MYFLSTQNKSTKTGGNNYEKNTIISVLLVTSTILSLMGCSAPSSNASEAEGELQLSEVAPEKTGETEETTSAESEETTDSSASESGDAIAETTVTVNGKAVSVLNDAEKTLADLGSPADKNIEFWGETMPVYKFDSGVSLSTYVKDGKEYAYCMDIRKEGINTARNIGVGSTKEEMIAAYGEPFEDKEEYERDGNKGKINWYEFDSYSVAFGIENGKVGYYYFTDKANNETFSNLVDAQVMSGT